MIVFGFISLALAAFGFLWLCGPAWSPFMFLRLFLALHFEGTFFFVDLDCVRLKELGFIAMFSKNDWAILFHKVKMGLAFVAFLMKGYFFWLLNGLGSCFLKCLVATCP